MSASSPSLYLCSVNGLLSFYGLMSISDCTYNLKWSPRKREPITYTALNIYFTRFSFQSASCRITILLVCKCEAQPKGRAESFLRTESLDLSLFCNSQGPLRNLLNISFLPINGHSHGFPGGSDDKESACNTRDPGSIAGSGRSPENGRTTHSSILKNSFFFFTRTEINFNSLKSAAVNRVL